MPDDGDDTAAALAMLRGLPAERDAEEAAERAAVPDSTVAQAARALLILEEKRPWTLDDRRALGLPASVSAENWQDTVRDRVSTLDPVAVVDAWLDLAEAGEGYRTLAVAANALTRLATVTPVSDRLRSLLRDGSIDTIRHVKEALVAAQPPIDDALLRLLRSLLVDTEASRQTATAALTIAGEVARREPAAAALIAERLRADRVLWRQEVYRAPSIPARAVDHDAGARVVERTGCLALGATAMLELEERRPGEPRWAQALVAVAGDVGQAHLERMRGRPGWGATVASSQPAGVGLDALVSPIADERRRAIDALTGTPKPELLCALLLAVELDRYVIRDVLHVSWTPLQATSWLPILASHESASRLDRRLAGLPQGASDFFDAVAATRAAHLLVELADTGAARAPMSVPQELTPRLQELLEVGARAFAERHIPDPRLTADELQALDDGEAQLAASAARWS